tara:strand:- start:1511 stop:2080 length:570 start_codon:yes stop_codon:yes gene_type:complete
MATEKTILDFQNNAIKKSIESQQEMFIHNYMPTYIDLDVEVAFVLVDQEFQFIIKKYDSSNMGSTLTIYESAEMEEPTITSYNFYDSDGTSDSSIIDFSLPEPEAERINYAKPVEFQIPLEEETATAQRDYINSIPRREIEFNMLSSLGSITSEGIVLDSTVTGAESQLTSATEAITDVGGPTATIGGY